MRRIPDDHYLLSGAKRSLTEELAGFADSSTF